MKVVIIGGGIIGCSVAAELSRTGADVTLIEKNEIGHGCSYGNAGWMTPCFAMPLPMPGMFFKSVKWLMDPQSPLYIKPQPSKLLASWMWRFLKSMNEEQAQPAIEALVKLSQISLTAYAELAKRHDIGFEKRGLLMAAQTLGGLDAAKDELNRVQKWQVPGEILSGEQTRALEPALQGPIAGAVYFTAEAHAEPLAVVKALAADARAHGAKLLENCELQSFEFSGNKVNKVITTQGDFDADVFVMATGSWSHQLAKQLDISVPILGGKGYALIVPPLSTQPKVPIMLIEKKIAVTPRNGSLRIAGTLELVDQDFSITEKRVQSIIKGAREFLPLPETLDVKELWRGLRPCTPDGLPLIGFHNRLQNMMLACGHQMLGLQSGLGTGILVRQLIQKTEQPTVPYTVYDPNRF